MQIYSETTFAFITKVKTYLRDIIKEETNLDLGRTRFTFNQYKYPIHIVIFTDSNKIGYFDPSTYQIGLNCSLIHTVKESVLKDIIRHEFAHYLTFIKNGDVLAHGREFKSICSQYNWDRSISKATMDIETSNELIQGDLKSDKMITRIKNLLSLSESSNEFEAQLATKKANELMLKHNLDIMNLKNEEPYFVKKVYESKKRNAKISTLYSILSHFLVTPILNYTSSGVRLEITGTKSNIEIGTYICEYLDRKLDQEWNLAKYKNNLKGLRHKNSFYQGFAKGFDEKMNEVNIDFTNSQSKELIAIKDELKSKTDRIYGRLKSSHSSASIDKSSHRLGASAGKKLTINKGLNKNKTKLIGWLR